MLIDCSGYYINQKWHIRELSIATSKQIHHFEIQSAFDRTLLDTLSLQKTIKMQMKNNGFLLTSSKRALKIEVIERMLDIMAKTGLVKRIVCCHPFILEIAGKLRILAINVKEILPLYVLNSLNLAKIINMDFPICELHQLRPLKCVKEDDCWCSKRFVALMSQLIYQNNRMLTQLSDEG